VARAQVGKDPTVCIWSSQTCKEIARVRLKSQRWVVALAFSVCGKKLVTVGADTHHTVSVWRWREGTLLSEAKGWSGLAPAIFGAAWNPFKPDGFVTHGHKHLKAWSHHAPTEPLAKPLQWKARNASFGTYATHVRMAATPPSSPSSVAQPTTSHRCTCTSVSTIQ
jgi:WD40 repeat protein